ncbi:MAG: UvrD-helicase domain-containing protein [Planctomycetota bacterium]
MTFILNPEQQQAVLQTTGPLLILAGAGSGKTRVITIRIVHLLKNGVPSERIWAVTFTNKAAQEMIERIGKMVPLTAKPYLSTFHSYCCRVLRKEGGALGFRPNFSIYTTPDQSSLLKQTIQTLKLTLDPDEALSEISLCKSRGMTSSRFREHYPERPLGQVYEQYQKSLAAYNAMDFDDLLLHTVELFKQFPEVLKRHQDEFSHIMIDEYQDTNPVQFELVALLSQPHQNLCVVGDDDQGIYSFRGAQTDNLTLFQKQYPQAKLIKLEQNYRSTNQILRASNLLIQNNTGRIQKKLWSKKPDGVPIRLLEARDEREEAKRVCDELLKHRAITKTSLDHYALLFRTNAQTRLFEEEFRKRGVQYHLIGGTKFYDRKEIRDVLSYFSVITNSRDELSLFRIINFPTRGIGTTSLQKMNQLSLHTKKGIFELMETVHQYPEISGTAQKGIQEFIDLIRHCRRLEKQQGLTAMGEYLLKAIHLQKELEQNSENSQESERRWSNVVELLNGMKHYETTEPEPNLSEYMRSMALFLNNDFQKEKDVIEERVTLITLHACKGLEFPHVFMVGMEEDLLPHFRSTLPHEIAEERRLCYVGITRAMESLTLSFARQRMQRNRSVVRLRSRFLDEIEEELSTAEPVWTPEQKEAVRQDSLAQIRAMLFKDKPS